MWSEAGGVGGEADSRDRKAGIEIGQIAGRCHQRSVRGDSRQIAAGGDPAIISFCVAECPSFTGTSGLQSRLSAVYNALNTYGITLPEDSVKLEDAENVLKVRMRVSQ